MRNNNTNHKEAKNANPIVLNKYNWISRVGIVNSIKRHDLAHWGVRILDAQVILDGKLLEVRVPVHTCTWDSTIIEGAATRYSVKA